MVQAVNFLKSLLKIKPRLLCSSYRNYYVGTGAPIVGKEHSEERSLEKYLSRKRAKDESLHFLVDIGLPFSTKIKKEESKRRTEFLNQKSQDKDMCKLAKKNQLVVPLDDVYDEWISTEGPFFIKKIAEHYGVYEHLFGEAFFYPVTPMSIAFKTNEQYSPVYFGNVIKPQDAQEEPFVDIGKKSSIFHSLVLSNLDGHLTKKDGEYIHWMVGNIPEADVMQGEIICTYLPPFPTKGTGYQRYVFVLYQHDEKIDFSQFKNLLRVEPSSRDFNTYEFYRDRQDFITPSSLLFFQTDWDYSVTNIFHNVFDMPEPRYEFDFPKPHFNPPVWFPKKKAFNTYLDLYRNPKQVSKEVLIKKLKSHNPFEKPEPPSKFPNFHTPHDTAGKASWIQVEKKKERLGWGRIYNSNKDIIDPK